MTAASGSRSFLHGMSRVLKACLMKIDGGLQTVTEPATGHGLAANVIACTWEKMNRLMPFSVRGCGEKANSETAERRKRLL